jgi:hypothetical protein
MNHPLTHSSQMLFATSALAFAASTYIFAPWNDVAWSLPVPVDGTTVRTPFLLATPGEFRVRLSVPTVSKSVDAPVQNWTGSPCLILRVDPEEEATEPIRLEEFRSSGLYVYGGVAYFESKKSLHLAGGNHTASLAACEAKIGSQLFAELQRSGGPTGQFVMAWLVRCAGWFFLVAGMIASAASVYLQRRRKNAA